MARSILISLLAVTVVLAACGPGGHAVNMTWKVAVGAAFGVQPRLGTQGVPTDTSGAPGVTMALLTVFRGAEEVFFDASGNEASEAESSPLVLTGAASTVGLNLIRGTYEFVVIALDDDDHELADGVVSDVLVDGAVGEVLVPLVSRLGSAELSNPVTVMPNQVFDVFLTVRPPDRPDLRVPTSDFDAYYDHVGTTQAVSSDVGIRLVAECEPIEVSAYVYAPGGLTPALTAQTEIGIDLTCPTSGVAVGVDLVPPYASILVPTPSASVVNGSASLSGEVSDFQSGLAAVDVYEGVRHVGTAVVTPGPDELSMSTWALTGAYLGDEERVYDLTVVAKDQAGNERRVNVSVNGVNQ